MLEPILLNRALAGVYFQTENLNGDSQAMKKNVPKITDLRILSLAMTEACVLVSLPGMLPSSGGID